MNSLDQLHTIFFTLILGGYLFTAWVFRYFNKRIEQLVVNHLHALAEKLIEADLRAGRAEVRLTNLEGKELDRSAKESQVE